MNPASHHVSLKLAAAPSHQMRSGVGASWHSILNAPVGHGGSAFGGQPPVLAVHEPLWKSIEAHATRLRLRFIRLEFEWRQFEPRRGEFTWDSPEMRILDRICAWAEQAGADVMLQQQWGGAAWNCFPEFRGDPAMETYSAPADLNAFADGWMSLLDELYVKRGYRCIKWINPINEPGYWWWHLPESYRLLRVEGDREGSRRLQLNYLAEACAILRRRLRAGHPGVRLMGPDETDMPAYERLAAEPWFAAVDDVDFHSYNSVFDHELLPKAWSYHIGDRIDSLVRRYSAESHAAGKGFYLTEVGSMVYGYGADNPAPGCHLSSLKDVEVLVRSLAAGVDGFSHWSFTNRGDIDGQWQLIDTWNIEHKNWLLEARPHRPAYDILGRATRHVPKCAQIFPVEVTDGGCIGEVREQSRQGRASLNEHYQRVWAVGVQNPDTNEMRILAVNNSEEPFEFTLELPECGGGEWSVLDPWTDAPVALERSLRGSHCLNGVLPPQQLTVLTT
ncbi:hypothetical protein [Geminisphaera colitermitum]|uniref:hypothetical protein n=1 Tax=Geminisphaera colitermitum TaxID=1148786 RepID=UPI000158CDDC|nr:hypothetical protein [Geminisphaera colitermitum]